MSRWFRFHTNAMRNPKVARLTDSQFRLWVELMSVAAENDGRIPCIDDLKHILKRRLDHLSRGLDDLISAELMDALEDGYEPHNWNKFQYKSDTSTDRVKKHRAKRNVSETPPETETDTETDIEEEAKASPSVSLPIDEAVEYWMLAAQKYGWKKPSLPLSQHRRKKLSSRLKENGMEGWKDALRRACQGRPGKEAPTWFTFDFITKNTDNILKVLEGNYDGEFFNGTGNNQNRGPGSTNAQVSDPILNAIHKRQKARMATDGLGEYQPLLSASGDPH